MLAAPWPKEVLGANFNFYLLGLSGRGRCGVLARRMMLNGPIKPEDLK
jgi:hypothetical protein